jgi:hypothetical protein
VRTLKLTVRSVTVCAAPLLLAGALAFSAAVPAGAAAAFPTFSGRLSGVAALSAASAWAVGYTYPIGSSVKTLIEHWNGKSWT